jgi:hypothetical protein
VPLRARHGIVCHESYGTQHPNASESLDRLDKKKENRKSISQKKIFSVKAGGDFESE